MGINPGGIRGGGVHPPWENLLYIPLQVGLPLAKNTKFVITIWVLSSSECTTTRFRPGPDPAGGAYDAPPDSLVGWGGGHPLPIPIPLDDRSRRHPTLLLKEIYANAFNFWNQIADSQVHPYARCNSSHTKLHTRPLSHGSLIFPRLMSGNIPLSPQTQQLHFRCFLVDSSSPMQSNSFSLPFSFTHLLYR